MMINRIIPAIAFIVLLSSCSSLKSLNFSNNNQAASANAVNTPKSPAKFIDDITVTPQAKNETVTDPAQTVSTRGLSIEKTDANKAENVVNNDLSTRNSAVEASSALQMKYAILLNTQVEHLKNEQLLQGVDEWYGTRYRLGGTSHTGVDCSAFVGAVYASVFGISLPRTAREQHRNTRRISRTELQEGDLLFFNTRGGVSHVGIYLQNNKFVHASVSKGVTIDDLFDPYYLKRFVGAGRVDNKESLVKKIP
jgi:cell wall-associated NlpC family hydrolase